MSKLLKRRWQARMSQRELAAASGVSKSTIVRIESDNPGTPQWKTFRALAKALRCKLGDIVEPLQEGGLVG